MFAVLARNNDGVYVSVLLSQKWDRAAEVGARYRADGHQVIVRSAGQQDIASYYTRKAARDDARVAALVDANS